MADGATMLFNAAAKFMGISPDDARTQIGKASELLSDVANRFDRIERKLDVILQSLPTSENVNDRERANGHDVVAANGNAGPGEHHG